MSTPRSAYYGHCLEQFGRRPGYVWGGKRDDGMDCSGFVALALFKASGGEIDHRATHNTDRMWAEYEVVLEADLLPGDLCFYWGESQGPLDVSHVMVYVGAGRCIGMYWGGRGDTDASSSRAAGKVAGQKPVRYRADLAGFRRPPVV